MSTIYEALRKAEERRRLGEAPSLIGDAAWAARRPLPAQASRGRWALWLLPAIVVALAGGWWLGRGTGPTPVPSDGAGTVADSTPAAAKPAAETSAAATSTTAVAAAPIAAMPPAPAPAPVPAMVQPVATTASPGDALASPPATTPATVVPAPAQAANPAESGPQSGFAAARPNEGAAIAVGLPPSAPDAEAIPLPPAPTAPPEVAPQPMPATPAATPSAALVAPPPATVAIASLPSPAAAIAPAPTPATATAPPAPSGTPLLYEMPLGTRQTLPPLKLSMHVYSPDPARRVVIIDGVRLLEGGTVSGELRVTQITPDGVVLQLGEQQFLLPRGGR